MASRRCLSHIRVFTTVLFARPMRDALCSNIRDTGDTRDTAAPELLATCGRQVRKQLCKRSCSHWVNRVTDECLELTQQTMAKVFRAVVPHASASISIQRLP